ncbi:MAG: HAD-IIB family hydrolase [Trueperaceae bacterium]|nr:HAD-IIB family hydrolase [Trueperaceae bacterium]
MSPEDDTSTTPTERSGGTAGRPLIVHMFSVHGLIRGHDLELGRDADTGGQTKYVVELARALGRREDVRDVVLFTRLIDDDRVSDDYAHEEEPIGESARIVRIRAGGTRYRRKELLWPSLDAFVQGVLRWNREHGVRPDLVHGHYADAGYVALEIASALALPLVFTGHSLGRNKVEVLRNAGVDEEALESRYKISHRIEVEEELLRKADVVIASTQHEVEYGYQLYEGHRSASYQVLPPGIDVERFYPWYYDQDRSFDAGDDIVEARVRMWRELERFLNDPDKPLVLAVSRPDRRKNIDGLITAYGEDKELQSIANLAVFAGVRKDIEEMDDNEREVLTDLLLSMDRYDLYGKLALPKKHDPGTDIPVLYRLAASSRGVFINPALVENFGITLIEASSSGLPVVSTDHGGPKEIIGTCGSGELVDTREPQEMQAALKRILVDEELWDTYSHAGIEGVRRHYSWTAHAETYLTAVWPLLETPADDLASDPWRSTVGRDLQGLRSMLISDIDGTLVQDEPDPEALEALADALRRNDIGFGVASGRSLALVEEAIDSYGLPDPQVIICDVGSEIRYGPSRILDRGFERHLQARWQRDAVRDTLLELGLEPQGEEAQTAVKLSFYLEDEARLTEICEALDARDLRYTLVWSHGRYLDVLPHRAGKGKAVRYVATKWGLDPKRVCVAGDSGNDAEMLRSRFRGIVVGNHASELEPLRGRRGIRFVDEPHARGVLAGLRAYGLVD